MAIRSSWCIPLDKQKKSLTIREITLFAVLGALLGAYLFYDFQSGLRLAASAVLIYCANMAFGDMKVAKHPAFAPALAA